jgi:hypothetical protein
MSKIDFKINRFGI